MHPVVISENPDELLEFCVCCFASSENGSWNHTIEGGHCYNCGAGGPETRMPRWAIDSIRKSASWVGKRYYPGEEDRAIQEEIKTLRAMVTTFPGRSVEMCDPGQWKVTQKTGKGRTTWILINALTEQEAFDKARTLLPYVANGDSL